MRHGPYDSKLDTSLFLTDFEAYELNRKTYEPTIRKSTTNPSIPSIPEYPRVYTWSVSFDSGGTRDIVNKYKIRTNSYSTGDKALTYVLKTGALWKDDIKDFSLWIMFHRIVYVTINCDEACLFSAIQGCNRITDVGAIYNKGITLRTDAVYIDLKNYKPKEDVWVTYIEDEAGRWRNRGLCLFGDEELSKKSLDELKFLRNEIYAQYGYEFKDKTWNALFENKRRIYHYNLRNDATQKYTDSLLSDYDRVNLEKIKRFEGQKKKP